MRRVRGYRHWQLGLWALVLAWGLTLPSGFAQSTAPSPPATVPIAQLTLPAPSEPVTYESGSVFFVGNATVIIRYAGLTILTDPNFLHAGDHTHLGYAVATRRLTNPAIEIEQLPPVDLVVLSHMHGDHFDQVVKQKLNRSWPIVTTDPAASELKQLGFQQTVGLKTWQKMTVQKGDTTLTVTAMPGQHGPGPLDALLPDVNGHMLTFQRPNPETGNLETTYQLYISGDTLVHDELRAIPQRFPDIDMALLHLGGTRVFGFLVSMDAQQGVQAMEILAPLEAIPIHYNDYDRFTSTLGDFQSAIRRTRLGSRVRYLKHGETYTFQARPTPTASPVNQ